MKIALDIQPEQAVACAVNSSPMNIFGPFSHWPRRQSEKSTIYDLQIASRFDPVVLN